MSVKNNPLVLGLCRRLRAFTKDPFPVDSATSVDVVAAIDVVEEGLLVEEYLWWWW